MEEKPKRKPNINDESLSELPMDVRLLMDLIEGNIELPSDTGRNFPGTIKAETLQDIARNLAAVGPHIGLKLPQDFDRFLPPDRHIITLKTIIIPGDKTAEGTLVAAVSTAWFEILKRIKADPNIIFQLDCWKWEEIIAGAYKQAGWDIVILTPKRGDHGVDIIATRADLGQLRFLDQVKAYRRDRLVGPDDIREMLGVLAMHQNATKGIITTTSGFSSGAIAAAEPFSPFRLELRPREKLVAWLASLI